jgi:hypothetical protein
VTISNAVSVTANFSQPPNIMFTTSTLQTAASLGGLAGADALCTNLAGTAKLTGTYKAWLSTQTVSAASRLGSASGWVRTDGKPVLNNISDIAYNKLFYPPRLDEKGTDLGASPWVITGTTPYGAGPTYPGFGTCKDYTGDDGVFVMSGWASSNSDMFTQAGSSACSVPSRIYCLGIDRQAQVGVTPAAGRHAFVTLASWAPGAGIASADALCQSEATTAKLPGTYKALLAPTGATAASRFAYGPNTLPWVRSDGILIAPTASAFFATTLFDTSPNITADGLRYYEGVTVWSGAATPTTAATDATNCANWFSSSGTAISNSGAAGDSSTTAFFNEWPIACNFEGGLLLCLQD